MATMTSDLTQADPAHRDLSRSDYAECTVCRSDTALVCSPCGDPVCHNCACPNGCQEELEAAA